MSKKKDRDRLSQVQMLASLIRDLQITEMLTVYYSAYGELHNYGIYCALVPNEQIEKVLFEPTWNLSNGDGIPSSIIYRGNGEESIKYYRFGNDEGIEPLIIDREFHGIHDDYKEISEEFRLFHRLYHDKKTDQYIKIDDSGNETVVAIIEEDRVQIRTKEIRQFLAIRDMHLAIQFDYREHSTYTLKELGIERKGKFDRRELACWEFHYGEFSGINNLHSFSRLLGKRLVKPLPKSKSGFWGFSEKPQKNHAEFIIAVDENGDEISHISDPGTLANFFGANPDAPNYLTPIHFRKEVLNKYYQQPTKYSIEDSMLWCGNLWSLQIDNHHDNKVCVWLGDLGRDLPYEEQLHWRVYNIPPEDGVSKTYFKRQILAQFTDSDRLEHMFALHYHRLQEACAKFLDWQLLLPLNQEDEHYLKCMRIPATDEQRDFDELILGLAKILIDSLNEKELNKLIPKDSRGTIKGSISRLETALIAVGEENADKHIEFLRRLQNLRSSGSAHRKGNNYRKIANDFGIDNQSLRTVFAGILEQALAFIDFLTTIIQQGKLARN